MKHTNHRPCSRHHNRMTHKTLSWPGSTQLTCSCSSVQQGIELLGLGHLIHSCCRGQALVYCPDLAAKCCNAPRCELELLQLFQRTARNVATLLCLGSMCKFQLVEQGLHDKIRRRASPTICIYICIYTMHSDWTAVLAQTLCAPPPPLQVTHSLSVWRLRVDCCFNTHAQALDRGVCHTQERG